ncbi:MAG: hypothetical protein R2710_29100 [Acidimicrobiales bacterium]
MITRVLQGVVTIAGVGDSRVYRLRDGELTQLTTDHTVAGTHALTRYVGAADGNDVPHVTSLAPQAGDRLLMLTDGVFKQLTDAQIVDALDGRSAGQGASELVTQADRAGGRDNATALIIDFAAQPAEVSHV